MIKTLSLSLLLLSVVGASAQQQAAWREVTPPKEEFTVLMPTSERKVSRVLPFADEQKLVSPVYEVYDDGLHFMVVSFDKWHQGQPELLKTFDGFSQGFEHAVRQSRERDGNTLEREEDFTLRGMKIRPYRVRMSGEKGVARLYEASQHFYAVVVLGATYGDARVDRYLKSFKVRTDEPKPKQPHDDADDSTALMTMIPPGGVVRRSEPAPPEEPWPIHRPVGMPRAPISGGVLNSKVMSKPEPEYPAIARAARASGTVTVQVTVDEEGKVISAIAVGGHPLLQQAAVTAAYKARFSPTLLSGQPVKVNGVLTYKFVLPTLPEPPESRVY